MATGLNNKDIDPNWAPFFKSAFVYPNRSHRGVRVVQIRPSALKPTDDRFHETIHPKTAHDYLKKRGYRT